MKKYWLVFLQSLSQYSAYRLNIIFTILQSFITPLFMVTALSFARSQSSITVSSLIPYYVLVAFVYPITRSDIDEELEQITTSGDVNNFLTKPFSLFRYLLVKDFSQRLIVFLSVVPLFLLALPWMKFDVSTGPIIYVIPMLFLSFVTSFGFSYLIGLMSFWIDEFWAIHNIKHVIVQLLGGVILPYSFFPDSIRSVIHLTPFAYMSGWVPRFVQGNTDISEVVISVFWIINFLLLIHFLEKKAIKKYSHTSN